MFSADSLSRSKFNSTVGIKLDSLFIGGLARRSASANAMSPEATESTTKSNANNKPEYGEGELDPILYAVLTSPLLSLGTFGFGLLVGNWLAIGRDRRQERNEAAQVVRAPLINQLDRLSPRSDVPSAVEIDMLEQRLPWFKRRYFRAAFRRYAESRKAYKQDKFGDAFYDDAASAAITVNIQRLLRYTEWH